MINHVFLHPFLHSRSNIVDVIMFDDAVRCHSECGLRLHGSYGLMLMDNN